MNTGDSPLRRRAWRWLLCSWLLAAIPADAATPDARTFPFDRFCPVFYDNDDHRDVYTDEYLMALAHLGELRLVAIATSYAPDAREFEAFVKGRERMAEHARASGLRGIPAPIAGAGARLVRPASNRIEDTAPLGLEAATVLIEQARGATPERPLVFLSGGQLTVAADALLRAPDIAPRLVVAGLFGVPNRDYNASLDSWAWTIVVSRCRVFAVPFGTPRQRGAVFLAAAEVPKEMIRRELPRAVPLFRWMADQHHPANYGPGEHDYDGQAAIALMRSDYIRAIRRWRPDGILSNGDIRLVRDESGPVIEAVEADRAIATAEFWRAMRALRDSLPPSTIPPPRLTEDGQPTGGALAGERFRVIISSDIGGGDPDDIQSLIHYLLHADRFDTEGLISSPPKAGRASDIHRVLDAYERDFPRLRRRSPQFPAPEALRRLVKQGATDPAPEAGWSEPTEGSGWIVERARAPDPRPLWVLVWGCLTDVAQALHDAPEIVPKLRVYSIGSWNTRHDPSAREYVAREHRHLWWIEADTTFRGAYVGGRQEGEWGNVEFVERYVRGRGSLGDLYWASKPDLKMGDTPSVLYLLRGPSEDPSADHWGGAFVRPHPDRPYWTDDPAPEAREVAGGRAYPGARTVSRWREAWLAEWRRRMSWLRAD